MKTLHLWAIAAAALVGCSNQPQNAVPQKDDHTAEMILAGENGMFCFSDLLIRHRNDFTFLDCRIDSCISTTDDRNKPCEVYYMTYQFRYFWLRKAENFYDSVKVTSTRYPNRDHRLDNKKEVQEKLEHYILNYRQ